MKNLGHKVLFICPTNELAEKYGKKKDDEEDDENEEEEAENNGIYGITINKFFGFGVTDEETKFMKQFNASEYDTIVFDEIFFNNVKILARIYNYVKNNPDKIIIATGDTQQLPPIEDITNQFDYKTYLNYCADQIFTHQIYLQDIKRIKDPEQKDTAIKIYDSILSCKNQINRNKIIRTYFKFTNNIINENNVAYKNATCKAVSLKVRKNLKDSKMNM
jgi:hypothetical protein